MTKKLPAGQPAAALDDQIQSQLCSFGARLRELRLRRQWTLEELACRSGLSRAFLSRLESGGRQASIAVTLMLCRIFSVPVGSLFEPEADSEPAVVMRAGEAAARTVNGLECATLSNAGKFFNLQPIKVIVPRSRRGGEHYRHEGEEWIYLLAGELKLSLDGQTYELAPGDAAHFDARRPHRLIACGRRDAELLLVAAPMISAAAAVRPALPQNHSLAFPVLQTFSPRSKVGPPPTQEVSLFNQTKHIH